MGGRRHFKGLNNIEISARKKAAQNGFYFIGRLWAKPLPLRPKCLVFNTMVRGVAISGLEACVLSEQDYKQLDSVVLRFAKKILRGDACRKDSNDRQIEYRALPDSDVFKLVRLVPAAVLARSRKAATVAQNSSRGDFWTDVF